MSGSLISAKLSKLILIAWCFTKPRVCLRPTKPNQATQSIVNKRAQIHCCPMLGNLQRKIFFRAGSTGGRNTCQVKLHLLSSLSEVTVKSNKLSHPLQFSEKKIVILSQPALPPSSVGKRFPGLFCIMGSLMQNLSVQKTSHESRMLLISLSGSQSLTLNDIIWVSHFVCRRLRLSLCRQSLEISDALWRRWN